MRLMQTVDFLIIGAGIGGAAAGYFLAPKGRLAIVEMESQPGYHTTGRSAAFFVESYGNRHIRPLTLASKGFLEVPPPGFTDVPLLHPRGALTIARADQMGRLAAFRAGLVGLVDDAEILGPDQLLDRVPVLRPGYLAGGVLEPDARDIDVAAVHQGYLRGIRRLGGRVLTDHRLTGLEAVGGGWRARTAGGDFRARVIVNAAGAWGDVVAAMAGVAPVGLQARRRTILTFPPAPAEDFGGWPVVLDVDEKFYFKPESGRILASPGDETPMAPCDVQPDDLDIAIAVDRLQKATRFTVPRIDNRWAGLRTFAVDKTPVIGPDATAPGFVWSVGQGGYGIMTSPAFGRLTAALAVGDAVPDDLATRGVMAAHYAPERLR